MPRANHWPTIARLITDSALWPRPRVSVTAIASAQNDSTALIAQTTMPSAAATVVSTIRAPRRSMKRPMPIAKSEPIERRPQIQLRVIDAADLQIGDQRLGDEAEALRPARQRADHGRCREQTASPTGTTRAHCRL